MKLGNILATTAACTFVATAGLQVSGGMNIFLNVIVGVIVVVVGTLLTGGCWSVFGIFFGTLTFAVVGDGIRFTEIDRNGSNLIIGVTLLGAVAMNERFRKLALNAAVGRTKPSQQNAPKAAFTGPTAQ